MSDRERLSHLFVLLLVRLRHVMGNLWTPSHKVAVDDFLQYPIGIGHPLVLALVFSAQDSNRNVSRNLLA